MSGGVTTNYGLAKPNFNVRPWDTQINSNFDIIDTLIYTLTQIPNIGGVWKNSTQYLAGQNVLDPITLTFYQCVVSNVSAATGTFAADRAANPANWTVTNAGIGALRYDQGQVLTAGQTLQAMNNLAAFSYFLRYDAPQTLTTPQLNQMLSNLQLVGALKYDTAQTLTYNQILQVLNNLLIDGTESILTAAATTDIGNAGSQNIRIDGATTIVSFGARPNKYKLLRFTSSLTLTNSASLVLPGGQNIQTLAGDTCIATSDANNNWCVRAYQRADGALPNAQIVDFCGAALSLVSSTQLVLKPVKTGLIWINGQHYRVPTAGAMLSNNGLSPSALYYVYVYNNSGVVTLEASTTSHSTDTTYGHEIKSGDPTRTLVGMFYTGAGTPGTFADAPATRWVASYYNRKAKNILGSIVNASTTSTGLTELSTSARVDFVCWADEAFTLQASAGIQHVTGGQFGQLLLCVDANSVGNPDTKTSSSGSTINTGTSTGYTQQTEGRHYGTAFGLSQNGAQCNFNPLQLSGSIRQ